MFCAAGCIRRLPYAIWTSSFSAAGAGVTVLEDSWPSSSAKASLTVPCGLLSRAWSLREPLSDLFRNSFWAAILSSSSLRFLICSWKGRTFIFFMFKVTRHRNLKEVIILEVKEVALNYWVNSWCPPGPPEVMVIFLGSSRLYVLEAPFFDISNSLGEKRWILLTS